MRETCSIEHCMIEDSALSPHPGLHGLLCGVNQAGEALLPCICSPPHAGLSAFCNHDRAGMQGKAGHGWSECCCRSEEAW